MAVEKPISCSFNGLESVGGNRVFSAALKHNFIPVRSLITDLELDGPLKLCRVDEKPAVKRFTAWII